MRNVGIVIALLASACAGPDWPSSGTFKGYYTYGFEESRFMPAGTKEKWWLTGTVPCRPEYTKENATEALKVTPILYVELRGRLSSKGHYGHMGAYSRELKPEDFVVCRKLLPDEKPEF